MIDTNIDIQSPTLGSHLLHEDLFEYPFCKSVYHAMCKLKDKNRPIDILTISKKVNISINCFLLISFINLDFFIFCLC